MDIDVVEQKKNKIIFKLKGATHTLCNILKKELQEDSHVKVATYSIKHPLTSDPRFIVETDGEDIKKVLVSAAERIKKTSDKFLEAFKKEVK
ncbi:MAG: DNA-directed RNA polymerase subunit L [Nanoarchaeota archaeon]|nr:DNA-directed RNA polymerase subunit L [Nanoarchaeota archaeon]MBU1704911.1 DNA-directed RNA polymerase subunit L [Nanoarchaeota archaeon]